MNKAAQSHITKANGYLAKGEAYYRKAGEEIIAAREEGADWTEIGDGLGRSKSWCEKIATWAKTPANGTSAPTPFAEPGRDNPDVRGAKRILREAPIEQVEEIISSLPEERVRQIAAATHKRPADRPNPVKPRADHLLYQYEGKLTSAETSLRQALSILAETDQPGDDEDILDQLNRLAQLVEINKESYRTGKSLDTWAAELEGSTE